MAKRTSSFSTTLILATTVGLTTLSAHAGVRTHADYIAIDVEGEENVSKDDRWVLTEPTTPAQEQDPDGNHSDTAVGNAYLELLPDIRVTHGDPFGPPTAIWGAAGTGPEMSFMVEFPEPGRYYVHVRALSTGSEDNGIHVGLNDDWPVHGERMQWCTGGRGWQWSSRQRDSGGAGPCGASHTVWLEVPSAGTHNVKFSAREDGFEFDRFILIKDLSDNTRICQPYNENDISCNNGSLESSDNFVDLGVEIEADLATVETGEDVNFTLTVINEDNFDTADNVEVNIAAGIGSDWEVVEMDEICSTAGTDLICSLGSIIPSNPHELNHTYTFTMKALTVGNSTLDASISSTDIDESPSNDSASVSVEIESSIRLTTMSANLSGDLSSRKVDDKIAATLELTNTGDDAALAVKTSIVIPKGLTLDEQPDNCAGTAILECDFGDLEADSSVRLELALTPTTDGFKSLLITPSADNLSDEPVTIQRNLLIVKESSSEEPVASAEDPDAGASNWMLISGLVALVMTRRRYKPTMALRRTA